MQQAGIPREATVIWNAVPWWNGRIPVTAAERALAMAETPCLRALLPALASVVLAGRTARLLRECFGPLPVFESAHPSPQVRAGNRAMWDAIPVIWRSAWLAADV